MNKSYRVVADEGPPGSEIFWLQALWNINPEEKSGKAGHKVWGISWRNSLSGNGGFRKRGSHWGVGQGLVWHLVISACTNTPLDRAANSGSSETYKLRDWKPNRHRWAVSVHTHSRWQWAYHSKHKRKHLSTSWLPGSRPSTSQRSQEGWVWAAQVAQRFSTTFSPGPDPGDLGSSPTSGSLHRVCFSFACVSASLSLCVSWINKQNLLKNKKRKIK